LLAPWLSLVPGLPRVSLGWLEARRPAPKIAEGGLETESHPPSAALAPRPAEPVPDPASGKPAEAATPVGPATLPSEPAPAAEAPPPATAPAPPAPLLLVLAYLGLASAFGLWWLAGVVKLRRLCRSCYPAPAAAARLLEQVAGPAAGRVRLLANDRLDL